MHITVINNTTYKFIATDGPLLSTYVDCWKPSVGSNDTQHFTLCCPNIITKVIHFILTIKTSKMHYFSTLFW